MKIKLSEAQLKNIIEKVIEEQGNMFGTAGVGIPTPFTRDNEKNNQTPKTKEDINPKKLKLGDGGNKNPKQKPDVIVLQQKLMDVGCMVTDTMKPTGYFGSVTNDALTRYNKNECNAPKNIKNNFKGKVSKQVQKQVDYLKSIGFDQPFTVLDDYNNLVHAFNSVDSLYKTYKVNTGANFGDKFDNDTAFSYAVKNIPSTIEYMKKHVGKDGVKLAFENNFFAAKKGLINNTPAGIFRRTSNVEDWLNNAIQTWWAEQATGPRVIQFEKLDGTNIAHGFHGTYNKERVKALKGGNVKARNITYGCINFTNKDIMDINNFIKYNQYTFWLSDVDTNRIEKFPNGNPFKK